MITAHHSVPAEFIDVVLSEGVIRPALVRIDPYSFDCNEILEMAHRDAQVNAKTQEMFLDWVDREKESLADFQRQEGFEGRQTSTQFSCLDFLAGDLDYVFLSLGAWARFPFQDTGFVFDAEALVDLGARVRKQDFVEGYEAALQRVLGRSYRSNEAFSKAATSALEFVKRGELHGTEALKFIRGEKWKHYSYPGSPELVWSGDLPVTLGAVKR